ncbi:general stress protein [Arthrobacter sp. GCM10027362]|uniref:general stress protein n=1 Tax=Arthrobacter sp. GCM10027362 TaxID=3273379 RepID=UPI00362BAF0F
MTSETFQHRSGVSVAAAPGASAVLAEFGNYLQAQRLVDRLSDEKFPVEHVRIVGLGISSVEQVTGRMTKGKAALAGAAGGAWLGLLIGLLFGLFVPGIVWLSVLPGSVLIAAAWGAVFGFIGHWASGGRRDFKSVTSLEAERYAVMVDAEYFAEAAAIANR